MKREHAERLARFLEERHEAYVVSLLDDVPLLRQADLPAVVEDWFACDIALLKGAMPRAYECFAVFSDYVAEHGLRLNDALQTLAKVRDHARKFCAEHIEGAESADICDTLQQLHDHWVDRFSVHYGDSMAKSVAAARRLQSAVADATDQAILLLNNDGVVEMGNSAFGALLGTSADTLLGRDFAELCSSETAAEVRRCLRQRAGAAAPRAFDGLITGGKALVARRRITAVPVFDGEGLRSGLLIAMERSLDEADFAGTLDSKLLETLADALGIGVAVWTAAGRLVQRNGMVDHLGLLGKDGRLTVCCGHQIDHKGQCGECFTAGVLTSGRSYRATFQLENDGDPPRWLEVVGLPLFTEAGTVSHVAVLAVDVTAKKGLENQILRQQSTSLVSQLAVGIAHELRNPLGVMIGFAQMIAQGLPSEQARNAADKLLRNGLRCKDILDHLLEFGKGLPSERSATGLNELILEHVRPMYPASVSQRIKWRLDEALPQVECAPQQIAQVLVNLIDNALWAAKKAVLVESTCQGDVVYIRVLDDGPGVPEDIRRRVFEPFFTTRAGEGRVGLGLSLSRSVVQEHHGQLYLDETVSTGACFVVQLSAAKGLQRPARRSAEPTAEDRRSQKRILIVDDELDLLEMLATALRIKGYGVDTAASGASAADLIAANDYDLVVLDVLLPGDLGGREMYQLLKGSKPEMAASTLFITADTMKYETRQFLDKVGRPHMEKPFLVSDFEEIIAAMLGEASKARPGV